MLLAGKPILQVPLVGEQQLTAEAVERLGAGVACRAGALSRERAVAALQQLISEDRYAKSAHEFSLRYSTFNPRTQQAEMLKRSGELIGSAPATSQSRRFSTVPLDGKT